MQGFQMEVLSPSHSISGAIELCQSAHHCRRMRKDALKALATASPDRFSAALEGLALKEALSGITEEGESETESGWKSQSSSVSVDDVIHLRAAMRHARFQDFIFGDPIGSGAFATVFRTKLREQHKSQSK